MNIENLLSIILPFIGFAFATSITPGANNIMLTASGSNYGLRKSMPHLFGIVTGFIVLMAASAMGLGVLFVKFPVLHIILRYMGSAYLVYLAWKVVSSGSSHQYEDSHRITFANAAIFQFVNPKVWSMAITAMSSFTLSGEYYAASAVVIAFLFALVYIPCGFAWLVFGLALNRFLKNKRVHHLINISMGLLLVLAAFFIVTK
ncbi:LysE family translocator [Candidatus Spongiihabitans sp.]|uniref:LysE family translocator n=1 Tax=Candidatus Spongiihabitans sp. TaxID=3101308 RepID=UPI003C6FE85F